MKQKNYVKVSQSSQDSWTLEVKIQERREMHRSILQNM